MYESVGRYVVSSYIFCECARLYQHNRDKLLFAIYIHLTSLYNFNVDSLDSKELNICHNFSIY